MLTVIGAPGWDALFMIQKLAPVRSASMPQVKRCATDWLVETSAPHNPKDPPKGPLLE
ncbi:MAG: hypothetical protein RLZZ217_2176 [Planctomycetota bacterium]